MADGDLDARYVTRREWMAWVTDVYDYRHTELVKAMQDLRIAVDTLARSTSHVASDQRTVRTAADTIERMVSKRWVVIGITVALMSPLIALADLAYQIAK